MATVIKSFRDRVTWRRYGPGDEYSADAQREAELVEIGLIAVEADVLPAPDLSAMTCAELRALCAERGVTAPKRATKAQLVALLD